MDEFQDTNIAQYEILRLLANSKDANIFAVADDDQVIFQWNGADPKRLEAFKNDYQPKIIQLPDNYRCPKQIVELANRLIAHNEIREKNKEPSKSLSNSTGIVEFRAFRNFNEELDGIAKILNDVPERQRESCLVIARNNKLLMDCTPDSRQIVKQQYLKQPPFRTSPEIYSQELNAASSCCTPSQ